MTKFTTAPAPKAFRVMMDAVDDVYDALLAKLGCTDGTDADLISHWQENGFRIQVSRKADGRALTRFVSLSGEIRV